MVFNQSLKPETRGKLRQFYRLLLSYGDFKHASYIASYIIENKLHASQDRRLLEALNCAMIIAYCRPFSGNDGDSDFKIPDLPQSFLKDLTNDEREIHEIAINDRHQVLAHSDSVAANLRPEVWIVGGSKLLRPVKYDTQAPLTLEATERFLSLSQKMFDKVMHERMRLEPELIDCFKQIPIERILKGNEELKPAYLKNDTK